MICTDPGHSYSIDNYDVSIDIDDAIFNQRIDFMKREGEGYPANVGIQTGTNCQELLRVLIDRVKYLNRQISCDANTAILQHLRMSLLLFEQRAAERHGRQLPIIPIHSIENILTCRVCGHIYCEDHAL